MIGCTFAKKNNIKCPESNRCSSPRGAAPHTNMQCHQPIIRRQKMARGRGQNRQKRPQKESGKGRKNNFRTPLLLGQTNRTHSRASDAELLHTEHNNRN